MKRHVEVLPRAKRDIAGILHWIKDTMRSPSGADAWLRRWETVLQSLEESAESWGLAPEDSDHDIDIRQVTFKTRRGSIYRALFTILGDRVIVLHVRGSGQDVIAPEDLALPD